AFPKSIPHTAVYTKSDGGVDWQVCLNGDDTDIEVTGTHVGLAWNPQVFRAIAERLHAACKQERPEELIYLEEPHRRGRRKAAPGKRRVKPEDRAAAGAA